jgi:hypothetical protein
MAWWRNLTVVGTVALGAAALAQGAGAEQKPAESTTAGKPTTIVGCLVQGLPEQVDGRPAVDTARYAQDFFVRTPTVRIPPGTTVAVGTPASGSTTPSFGTPVEDSFYRVTGLAADRLQPHLGHRIELQGQLTDNTPGTEATRATTTQDKDGRVTTRVDTRIAIAGVLQATTLKRISADCAK